MNHLYFGGRFYGKFTIGEPLSIFFQCLRTFATFEIAQQNGQRLLKLVSHDRPTRRTDQRPSGQTDL
ncbi:unnamed protein product, partial [Nesidiocoris tenuis]